jgi:hypothetical protein
VRFVSGGRQLVVNRQSHVVSLPFIVQYPGQFVTHEMELAARTLPPRPAVTRLCDLLPRFWLAFVPFAPGTPNANCLTLIECLEQVSAVRLAGEVVSRRVSELPLVVANLGSGFGEGVLVAQFPRSEIAVNTRLIT